MCVPIPIFLTHLLAWDSLPSGCAFSGKLCQLGLVGGNSQPRSGGLHDMQVGKKSEVVEAGCACSEQEGFLSLLKQQYQVKHPAAARTARACILLTPHLCSVDACRHVDNKDCVMCANCLRSCPSGSAQVRHICPINVNACTFYGNGEMQVYHIHSVTQLFTFFCLHALTGGDQIIRAWW